MRLHTVYVRFYKSFNYDFLRKVHGKAKPRPWETMDGMWYPFVRIPVDSEVTTVVGANESGKSHLLGAIKKGISGENITREDFCRYSQFFTVEVGKLRLPDFGFEWVDLSKQESDTVLSACKLGDHKEIERFFLFRTNGKRATVYLSPDEGSGGYELDNSGAAAIAAMLPRVFEIDAKVALPDSVPILQLADQSEDGPHSWINSLGRHRRFELYNGIRNLSSSYADIQAVQNGAEQIANTFASFRAGETNSSGSGRPTNDQLELARKLVLKVARIAPDALMDLYRAIRDGRDGHANGIIQQINANLASSLNFPRWWVQDKNFQLRVSAREFDLVFTICDKTGTEYSFDERSSGLKYFLSYYVQYRSYEPAGLRDEILLMDEPDAFLSSEAQQDLLKIFQAFAAPEDDRRPVQVVYVTHSPFLIDKNQAGRIRVLEKGIGDEGTRVVRDASKNHYEPLRSAFGAFVGETTFIGNCNLVVEGPADQILLAGTASYLKRRRASKLETLDLNHITIVPAGSAPHIPYMVYLARGRDVEQPAVIVLLDSDPSGNSAKKDLERSGPRRKQLLKPEYVLQIGDLASELIPLYSQRLIEIEDLVPLHLCVLAARKYARDIGGYDADFQSTITVELVQNKLTANKSAFDAMHKAVQDLTNGELHIDKVGFARGIVDLLEDQSVDGATREALDTYILNMKALFRRLDVMRRAAERELGQERVSRRLSRAKDNFLKDHPATARREEAHVLLDELSAVLDESQESDMAKVAIASLRRDYDLNVDMTEPIADFQLFKDGLEKVKYSGLIASQLPDDSDAES